MVSGASESGRLPQMWLENDGKSVSENETKEIGEHLKFYPVSLRKKKASPQFKRRMR